MKLYRFKTFTTSYYFPKIESSEKFLYGLYSPYGGWKACLYWALFKKIGALRELTAVNEKRLDFPYQEIKAVEGSGARMSLNMGSPGAEQKISILGVDGISGNRFFAKFSQKPVAMQLTRNEISIYRRLEGAGLTPKLLDAREGNGYVFMKAEYIEGARPKERNLDEAGLKLALHLAEYHLDTRNATDGLKTSLSHGDFCPWNILENGGQLRLIDWELAAERSLGFDILTWICQVTILFEPQKPLIRSIEDYSAFLARYFSALGVEDKLPYLKAFALSKLSYEKGKGNHLAEEKYKQLVEALDA